MYKHSTHTNPALWSWIFFLQIIVIGAPLAFLAAIGGSSEAREVHIAFQMAEAGEWFLPSRNGILPSKPPLFHWCAALFSLIPGVVFSAGVVRLVSVGAAAILTFISVRTSVMLFTRSSFTQNNHSVVGFLTGSILVTTYLFLQLSIDARVDMLFSLFVSAAILYGLSVLTRYPLLFSPTEKDFLILSCLCGAAVLTKGPLGVGLPVLVLGACSCFLYGIRPTMSALLFPRWSWLVFLLIVIPWYTYASITAGDAFTERQLFFENVMRIVGGEKMNSKPWWYYVPRFFRLFFPWSFLCVAGLPLLLRRSAEYSALAAWRHKVRLLPLIWILSTVCFFSIVSGKRGSYLLPISPAVALFATFTILEMLSRLSELPRLSSCIRISLCSLHTCLFLLFFAIVCVAEMYFLQTFEINREGEWLYRDVLGGLRPWLFFSLAAAVLTLFFLPERGAGLERNYFRVCSASIVIYTLVASGLYIKGELKGFKETASSINKIVPPEANLTIIRQHREEYFDPLMYYLKRPVTVSSKVIPSDYILVPEYRMERFIEALQHQCMGAPVVYLNEKLDEVKGKTTRLLALFDCKG